jgi:hypothetical protein
MCSSRWLERLTKRPYAVNVEDWTHPRKRSQRGGRIEEGSKEREVPMGVLRVSERWRAEGGGVEGY